jgi:phosphomannomutase
LAGPSFYRRIDVHVDQDLYPTLKDRLLMELKANAPRVLAGEPVSRTDALTTNDGFKFFTPDGSWLLIRFSGTEPLVRVYTEAVSPEVRDAMVQAGEALVRAA